MTLGLIPKSHFLTAGTDPNVTFGQCQVTCNSEEEALKVAAEIGLSIVLIDKTYMVVGTPDALRTCLHSSGVSFPSLFLSALLNIRRI